MTESELDLEAIEERCNEATPGPWTVNEDGGLMASKGYELIGSDGDAVWMMSHDDAVFIAHAREDIPALIREVRRLREEVRAAQIADENAIRNSPLSKAHTQVVLQNDQLVERIKELEQDASILREMLRSDRVGLAILMGIISGNEADESFNKKIKAQIEDELAFRKRSIISQMRKEG